MIKKWSLFSIALACPLILILITEFSLVSVYLNQNQQSVAYSDPHPTEAHANVHLENNTSDWDRSERPNFCLRHSYLLTVVKT